MAATRVTFVSGTAEVKRREKAEEEMVTASSSCVVGDRGSPYHSRALDERGWGGIESVTPAQPVTYVDGKCTCCPYGYHVDLDFVGFCQDVADGNGTLTNLKRIQRTKRKLRKSMEVMLHQQQQHEDSATAVLAPTPPPDVVHSTEASRLINMVQYEQTASHQVLRHIDSSVSATLAGVDYRGGATRTQRYASSDSEDGYSFGPVSPVSPSSLNPGGSYSSQPPPYPSPPLRSAPPPPHRRPHYHHHHHPSNGDESSHFATSLSTSGRTDSVSSLSSVSTVSSEQVSGQYTAHASGMLTALPHETATAQVVPVRSEPPHTRHVSHATAMTTSERLAATMATHFPPHLDARESPSSPISPNTTIGKASLTAIREAMAVSLQRMRELEEQVRAIPILQVRISVLKEEKRLLALQLKARSGAGASVRSVGVGDDSIYSPLTISTTSPHFSFPSSSSPFAPLAASPGVGSLGKARRMRTVGVGEHSVVEPYLLQPELPTGHTITDNLVQTEIRTRETLERHLPSLSVSTDQHLLNHQGPRSPMGHTHFTINQIQRSSPRPLTRSIGVGDSNVLDSSLQIHEKELRTVYIGGGANGTTGKRNVGVEVRVPTRSVGVNYSCDDARPATRSVGVNVNYDTSGVLTTLDFKGESELRMALRGVLQRNVHSVAIQCSFQPQLMHTGVQHESFNMVSVGCGGEDCRTDVDIRQPVTLRSLGVMAKPEMSSRVAATEKDWVLERGTNTVTVETYNKGSSTESRRMATTATNTEHLAFKELASQTDGDVFQSLQSIKTIGVNTTPTPTTTRAANTITPLTNTRGVNTKAADLTTESFDVDISFDSKAINTVKQFSDRAVNTSARGLRLSVTKTESIDVAGEVEQRPLTKQEEIIQRGANQASAFIGSTSSSGSLSPTGPRSQKLEENESVRRTVTETVYTTSPATFHQTWTSREGGSSDVFTSGVERASREVTSSNSGTLGSLSDNSGGGYGRSVITRTITSGGIGERMGGGVGGSGSGGGSSYRSAITRTISGSLSSGDGDRIDGGGDEGSSRSTSTKTFTSSGGGITQNSSGDADNNSSSSGSGSSSITRSIVTKTIATGGGGYGFSGDDNTSQGGTVISSLITGHRNMGAAAGGGFGVSSSSFGSGDGIQRSTVTKSFTSTGGVGGGGGGFSSSREGGSSMEGGSSVSRTVHTSSEGRRRERGVSDDLDAGGEGSGQERRTVTETFESGGGGGGDGGDLGVRRRGGGITAKTITITRTTRSGGTRIVGGESSSPGEGSMGFTSKAIPEGGTSYLERFGFARNAAAAAANQSTSSTGGSSIHTSTTVLTQGQGETTSGLSSGSFQSSASCSQGTEGGGLAGQSEWGGEGAGVQVMEGRAVLQSSALPSIQVTLVGGGAGGGGGGSLEQDSSSQRMTSQGMTSQSMTSQGMTSQSVTSQSAASSSDSAQSPDVSGGGHSVMTKSVVVKRSSGGQSSKQSRHSDGAHLSSDLGEGQGAFSGRRVGSVEDFMPNDMRRLMNIEVTGSASKSKTRSGAKSGLVTKTVKMVTTKRTSQGGKSTTSVTKTITNPDGTVTTVTDTEEESTGRPQNLGPLGSPQADRSNTSSGGDSSVDPQTPDGSETKVMKDSGCYDSSTGEWRSLEDVDMSAMGSLERQQLKSIMKRARSEESAASKKGISFADSVVGGPVSPDFRTGSSTEEDATESDDESIASYEEGSYDGREGDITYQCRDDEAIARGLPGAKMYDQNIRETYELSQGMRQSCQLLADYLVDSTTIQSKQLNSNLSVVQEEWLRVSSLKLSSAHQVEDYLSSINEISHRLLDYIVNLVDNNGNAAIHYCVSHCNFDIVGLLLDTEVCNVCRPNKAGYSPAMLASLAHVQNDDHRRIILRLFTASDINARAEQSGQTALMLAVSQCRPDMVELLLESGADCNVQDFDGSTALMCACEHGHSHIAQLLLAQPGCDASMADNESSTALSIAMEAGHKDIGVILYKHLNFSKTASPALSRKRKGTSSPTPRNPPH